MLNLLKTKWISVPFLRSQPITIGSAISNRGISSNLVQGIGWRLATNYRVKLVVISTGLFYDKSEISPHPFHTTKISACVSFDNYAIKSLMLFVCCLKEVVEGCCWWSCNPIKVWLKMNTKLLRKKETLFFSRHLLTSNVINEVLPQNAKTFTTWNWIFSGVFLCKEMIIIFVKIEC